MGFWRTFAKKYDEMYDDLYGKVLAGAALSIGGFGVGVVGGTVYSVAVVEGDSGIKGDAVSTIVVQDLTRDIDRIADVEKKINLVGSFIQASDYYLQKDNPQQAALKARAEADVAALKTSFAADHYKIATRITMDRTLSESDSKKIYQYLDNKIEAVFPIEGKVYEDFLHECRAEVPSGLTENVMSCTADKVGTFGKTVLYGGPAAGLAVYLGIPLMSAFGAHRRQRRQERDLHTQKIAVRAIHEP